MSRNIFFISDTHFGHENFLKFRDEGGERIRKEFDSVVEMDDAMIERWNARVSPQDLIYHLGDVIFGTPDDLDRIMGRLHGQKRLILGNHDKMDMGVYRKHFQKIMSWRYFSTDVTGCNTTFVACHYPLHPTTVKGDHAWSGQNYCVHGHLHKRKIDDPAYINVCVENTNYAPVSLDELLAQMAA